MAKTQDVYAPSVIYNPNNSDPYRMWYSKHVKLRWAIGYAISKDGKHWNEQKIVLNSKALKDSNSKISKDFDSYDAYTPLVIHNSNNFNIPYKSHKLYSPYKMWYTGHDGSYYRIGYATSPDGINWIKHGMILDHGNPGDFDCYDIYVPSVIYDPSDSNAPYKMWYSGFNGSHYIIGYATSLDGISWTKHGKVLDIGSSKDFDNHDVDAPMIIYDPNDINAPYKMWYSGYDGFRWKIGYAISKDRKHWTKQGVISNLENSGDFDNVNVGIPFVIYSPNDIDIPYRMWYAGFDKFCIRTGYAISQDGINWTKKGIISVQ